jgi:hypothetical protein
LHRTLIYRLLFIAVILVGFWLRVADLNRIPPGLHYDEGENLQRSWRLIHGYGFLPNFEGIPEPFDAYVRAGFLSIVGVLPFNARLYAVFLNLLGIAATIATARALYWKHPYREPIALTAALTIAALPPFAMIGRGIYASNWIPFTTMMSLTALVWAWRTNQRRYFILAGVLLALGVTFYLAGLAFVGAFVLLVLLFAAYRCFKWPTRRQLATLAISGLITLIPWFSMFLWIPDWMTQRLGALAAPNLSDPAVLAAQIRAAIQPIFIPNTVRFPVYNPYTIAFLNPALFILFLIGLLVTLWHWRKPLSLAPVVILGVMIVPNILSNVPEQPIRMSGIYGPLALLTGLGAGEALRFGCQRLRPSVCRNAKRTQHVVSLQGASDGGAGRILYSTVWAALAVILIITPLNTYAGVWHHYHAEPRLLDDPTDVRSWAFLYRQGYLDLMQQVEESSEPIYIPVEQLNSDLATVALRPSLYPNVHAYDGRPLPDGTLLLPTVSLTFGLPEVEYAPLQYALVLPDSREILILPPISLEEAEALQRRAETEGDELLTTQGWHIGYTLDIAADANPFATAAFDPGEPLAVFDSRLELLGIDAPQELTPGSFIPVTLYWRLREGRGQDYFVRLQAWDYNNVSRGTQNDKYGLIFRYLYPPVMWQAGEIVTETRWIEVYEDAPPGGYRFAISVSAYPGPTPVNLTPGSAQQQNEWALVGQSAVSRSTYLAVQDAPTVSIDAVLGDQIRLLGVTFDPPLDAIAPGSTLHVQLYWEAINPIVESYTLFLHLKDRDGNLIAQQDTLPFEGQYPTWAWSVGQNVVTSHILDMSAEASGDYVLSVGMYRYPSLERLAVVQEGERVPDSVVTIAPDDL